MKIVYKRVGQLPAIQDVPVITADLIKQGIGGGWLEACRWARGVTLWIDEEGLLKPLPGNFPVRFGPDSLLGDGQVICGDVVFTGCTPNGDEIGLTDEQIQQILRYFAGIPEDWERWIPEDWREPKIVVESMSAEEFIRKLAGG